MTAETPDDTTAEPTIDEVAALEAEVAQEASVDELEDDVVLLRQMLADTRRDLRQAKRERRQDARFARRDARYDRRLERRG